MRSLAIIGWVLVASCAGKTTAESAGGDPVEAGASPLSFDPRGSSTACVTKSDCMLAPVIRNCTTCCTTAPVNAAAVQAEIEGVEQACAGRRRNCLMACGEEHAECIDQKCIACSERPCPAGVLVRTAIGLTEQGKFTFVATIDGTTTECSYERTSGTTWRCSSPAVDIQFSDPLTIELRTTTAKAITLRATRDGTPIADMSFEPAYASEPGPNGPQCEPRECMVARAMLQ